MASTNRDIMEKQALARIFLSACFFLFITVVISFSFAGPAEAASGEIAGIAASGDLTVRAIDTMELNAGDTVEISYMAGVIEMLIGTYRVTGTDDMRGATLRPVSVNMPPSKGMRVIINMAPPSGIFPLQKQDAAPDKTM